MEFLIRFGEHIDAHMPSKMKRLHICIYMYCIVMHACLILALIYTEFAEKEYMLKVEMHSLNKNS
jgi:hypothetical protein